MKWKKILISKRDGTIVFDASMDELPVKENYLIQKSIELYAEPEPCIIYRTQIAKKVLLELYNAIEKCGKGNTISCNQLTEYFDKIDLNVVDAFIDM